MDQWHVFFNEEQLLCLVAKQSVSFLRHHVSSGRKQTLRVHTSARCRQIFTSKLRQKPVTRLVASPVFQQATLQLNGGLQQI